MSIRVILADDHTIVRHGLSKLLQQEEGMEVIAHAEAEAEVAEPEAVA